MGGACGPNGLPKTALRGRMYARRPIGKFRERWEDTLDEDSQALLVIRSWRRASSDGEGLQAIAKLKKEKNIISTHTCLIIVNTKIRRNLSSSRKNQKIYPKTLTKTSFACQH